MDKRNYTSWVPKYTLAELQSMRTKPYLGFIPRRETAVIDGIMDQPSCKIHEAQFNLIDITAYDIIEIGKSLIFHSDNWDIVRACCMHIDAKVEYNSIARLLLSVDLYSPVTALAICCKAIMCAYDSPIYWPSVRYTPGHPVWKWVDTHQSIGLIRKEQENMYAVVSELAIGDKRTRAREARNQYSVETMNSFLELHNSPRSYLSVMRYQDMTYGDMPISVNAFMRQQTGCIECAIAARVDRKCTQDHAEKKAAVAPMQADVRKDKAHEPAVPKPVAYEPQYAERQHDEPRYVEPAYFTPPPSAPPMEEMHHI
jgi:hypothetical protein